MSKGSLPHMVRINPQACCDYYHPITTLYIGCKYLLRACEWVLLLVEETVLANNFNHQGESVAT